MHAIDVPIKDVKSKIYFRESAAARRDFPAATAFERRFLVNSAAVPMVVHLVTPRDTFAIRFVSPHANLLCASRIPRKGVGGGGTSSLKRNAETLKMRNSVLSVRVGLCGAKLLVCAVCAIIVLVFRSSVGFSDRINGEGT